MNMRFLASNVKSLNLNIFEAKEKQQCVHYPVLRLISKFLKITRIHSNFINRKVNLMRRAVIYHIFVLGRRRSKVTF